MVAIGRCEKFPAGRWPGTCEECVCPTTPLCGVGGSAGAPQSTVCLRRAGPAAWGPMTGHEPPLLSSAWASPAPTLWGAGGANVGPPSWKPGSSDSDRAPRCPGHCGWRLELVSFPRTHNPTGLFSVTQSTTVLAGWPLGYLPRPKPNRERESQEPSPASPSPGPN